MFCLYSGDGIASDEPSLAADNENNHGTSGKFKINFFNTSSLFLLFKSDIYSPGVASYDVSKPGGVSIKYRLVFVGSWYKFILI